MYTSSDTLNQTPVKPISKLLHSNRRLDHQDGTGQSITHCRMIRTAGLCKGHVESRFHHKQSLPNPGSRYQGQWACRSIEELQIPSSDIP